LDLNIIFLPLLFLLPFFFLCIHIFRFLGMPFQTNMLATANQFLFRLCLERVGRKI
jgi:hypothetical protein